MRARHWFLLICLTLSTGEVVSAAGTVGTLVVRVLNGSAPVPSAEVTGGDLTALTDARGEARLPLAEGGYQVTVSRDGFEPAALPVTVIAGQETTAVVQMRLRKFEDAVTVVAATRSGTMVEDQAIRVEALPEEEIEENSTLAPGNLSTLLNEIGGLRVQVTSPVLGGTNLRFQGLAGRYTQILTDELPLYGAEPDAFALLQVPPLDLAQVEIVKGAASALYGGTALGGIVNLVSRRPGGEPEVLVSQSLHAGTDAVGFVSGKLGRRWGYTLLGAGDRQSERDLDEDGWADLPGYRRGVVRPRLFWDDAAGHSLFLTLGGTTEHREGGTVDRATAPDGAPFREKLDSRRVDGGLVGRFLVGGDRLVSVHASFASAWQDHRFGEERERNLRSSGSAEVSFSGSGRGHTWVAGAALETDHTRLQDVAGFDSTSTAPGLFVQDEYSPTERLSVSASLRADDSSRAGTFVNPRFSALVRPGKGWTVRLSWGTGYSAPQPFIDETEAVGFSRLVPMGDLRAERARSASIDVGWSAGRFEIDETLFSSRVSDPLILRPAAAEPGRFEIANAARPTNAFGSQFLARFSNGPLHVILTHTYLRSTAADPQGSGRRESPLTPRHAAELAILWEKESRGRLGVEISYTGRQALEANPYRAESLPYVELGVLAELQLGSAKLFANATNLTGVRQTRFDPLLLPQRAPDGRWTTDAWAPLEGRALNAGVRLEF